ncbi:unnamed protein product, partial [Brassica oleracea var. botrytis]
MKLRSKLFMEHLEGTPRKFFNKMISIYYKRDMHHKLFEKLVKKYPPPQWEFRHIKGRRVKVKAKQLNELSEGEGGFSSDEDNNGDEIESKSEMLLSDKEPNKVDEPVK